MEMMIDLKLMLTTFGMVFLAELGDKTQLATFCLSADCGNFKYSVLIGSAGMLVLSSLIAVLFGEFIGKLIPSLYIKIGAGLFFVVVGIWMLFTSARIICSL